MKNKKMVLWIALFVVVIIQAYSQQYNAESEFKVQRKENGVEITDYVGKKTVVNIPPRIQNFPVISIGGDAFTGNKDITSVTIPDSVKNIEDGGGSEIVLGAFAYCTRLASVTIGNSVTDIGMGVFAGCTSLTSITIPDSVTNIGSFVFSDCTSLASVIIGNSVTSIGNFAFDSCTSLTSITIPNSVTDIGNGAFSGCERLTSVTFQGKITSSGFGDYNVFPGDLKTKYLARGSGMYTRARGGTTWTKQ